MLNSATPVLIDFLKAMSPFAVKKFGFDPDAFVHELVDSLIAANKDFDLIMFPNRRHGFGNEPYMTRRRWDYFVKHLLGAEPPREYEMRTETAVRRPGTSAFSSFTCTAGT